MGFYVNNQSKQRKAFKELKESLIDHTKSIARLSDTNDFLVVSTLHYAIGYLEENHQEVSELLAFIANINNEIYKDIHPPNTISDEDFHRIFSNNFDNDHNG